MKHFTDDKKFWDWVDRKGYTTEHLSRPCFILVVAYKGSKPQGYIMISGMRT